MKPEDMKNKNKIILDLCGGTGAWSKPYKDAGYDVRVITLPDYDVKEFAEYPNPMDGLIRGRNSEIYGILAAPPCTEFAVSGARWWKDKDPNLLVEAVEIVHACLLIIEKSKPKFWALENPVGRLRKIVSQLGDPKLIFNPCDYGDPYTKRTCLWGNFNIPKQNPVEPEFVEFTTKKGEKKRMSKIHWNAFRLKPYERMEMRSKTPAGFAKAFFENNK